MGIVAASALMRDVLREAVLVAPTDSRVLITGESGAGKEVIADLVHVLSPRAAAPLIKINCAAIPEPLLESELFGHERGSFTGAVARHIGRFEQAGGGSILLDEIAEMSPALQAKLLRVTQDGSFRRVGGSQELRSDARIMTSTNRNLEEETRAGRFRQDLYFRLGVFEIFVPPLRERRADILPLANQFAAAADQPPRISPAAAALLELYDWPGNARELRNAIERATLMARGGVILPDHLPRRIASASGQAVPADAPSRMEEIERSVILQTLRANHYNRSETARVLGISRRALIYKLRRFHEQGYPIEAE
jgi:DNA-binding NtrC family response regulator